MKKVFLIALFLSSISMNAQTIYKPNKEYVFLAKYLTDTAKDSCYISMWTTENTWEFDSKQHELVYAYRNVSDSLVEKWPYQITETTGIIEDQKTIWMHPPRSDKFSILEYFPFPEIEFPIKCGKKYKRSFLGNIDFLEKFGYIRYKMHVECDGNNTIISGHANNRLGHWILQYTFNSQNGFTNMKFIYNNIQINFELVEVIEHQ